MHHDNDGMFTEIGRELRRTSGVRAAFDRRVMAVVRSLPPHRLGPWARFNRPRTLIVNPGSWLLAAAAALILVVGTSAGVSYVRATRLAAATVPSGKNVQFLLVAPGAHKVSVVGDFNGWDAWHAAYQAIHHADGVWTLTALVPTGPHRFAFVVDDSVWMADPNAPRGSGRDYGVPVSALVVGDDR